MAGKSTEDAQLLRRYLLGTATSDEQSLVERRLLSEDQYLNEVTRSEEDLIGDYVGGRLAGQDKQQFESYFLNSGERRDQTQFAAALNRYLASHRDEAMLSEKAVPDPTRFGVVWQMPFIRVAAFAALLLIGALVVLVKEDVGLQRQVRALKAQQAEITKREQALTQQLAEQRTRADQLAAELEQNGRKRPQAEHSQGRPNYEEDREVASLSLSPGLSRGTEKIPAIALSSKTRHLRLELQLPNSDYKKLHVELQTVEGAIVWAGDVQTHKTASRTVATALLATPLLTRSDYVVMLNDITTAGASEKIATYYFTVERK